MAFLINSSVIINDSRELIGVNTAGINTALFVGDNIQMDAASGVITAAGLDLGTGAVTYTEVSTDLGISSAPTDLASAEAIVNYVSSQIGGGSLLEIIGDNGVQGEIDLANNEIFDLEGTPNQIVSNIGGVGFNTVTFALDSALQLPGTLAFGAGDAVSSISTVISGASTDAELPTAKAVIDAIDGVVTGDITANSVTTTDFVSVGTGLTVGGDLRFGTDTESVNEIVETVDSSSTNDQLPTALAVFNALDTAVTGFIDADGIQVSGVSTFNGAVLANGGIDVQGHTETDTLRVSGLSTFQGNVEFDTGVSFTFADDGQPINAVGVATDLGGGTPVDTTLPTQRAVKLYVDSQIGAANQLTFSDGTTTGEIDLATETLLFNGGTNINLEVNAAQGNELTINLDDSIVLAGDLQAGVITATGDINANGNIVGDSATNISGINSVTAAEFYGDGSNLTDISATDITATPELTGSTPRAIAFLDAPVGSATILTDLSELSYVPDTGTLSATDFNTLSDIRYKENVETIEGALEKVDALRGVTYNWKSNGQASVGVIAQEVQAVLPQLITEGEEKITVNYNGLVGLLLQAVKELSARVEELESK